MTVQTGTDKFSSALAAGVSLFVFLPPLLLQAAPATLRQHTVIADGHPLALWAKSARNSRLDSIECPLAIRMSN